MGNETEGRPAGNNDAMREALERCNELFRCDNDNKPRLCHLARKADEATQAALAAPPRNCDRFGDELDAQLAFLNEEWLISVDRDSMLEKDKFENWTDQMRSAYARWLMATAKGDNHARND